MGDLTECQSCNRKRLRSKVLCRACGQTRRPSLADRTRCEHCVGEQVRQICRSCGVEEENHTGGRCARCTLAEVLRRLSADADPAALDRLEPYLKALGEGPQPATTLKWMGYSAGYETVIELATGAREISHRALDEVDRGMTTSFLRAALVAHGALEPRAEQSAKFARAAATAIRSSPPGGDATHVRAFALWQVQHDLARRERHGRCTSRSADNSLRLVRAAVHLSVWAAEHGMTLAELRQEHLDHWLQTGATTESVAPFLKWAARGRLMAPLTAARAPARSHVEPAGSEERLRIVRRLLSDDALYLRDRVLGCLLLIYAQPLTRILALTVEDVFIDADRVWLRLGRTPLELPDPLAELVAALARGPRGRATTAAARTSPRWLFAGMRVGAPLDHTQAAKRLKRLGIRPLQARTGAIIALAGALPPSILADLLGISQSSASKWYSLAGGEWTRYATHAAIEASQPAAAQGRCVG